MTDAGASYGLWLLVFINSAVFIIFAFSFFKPQTKRDWRSFGAFSAFVVALFTEMYGFPLTIFFLSGWLQSTWPEVDWFAHDSGHLPEMMFGWQSNPHFGPFHLLSFAFIGGGFWLISLLTLAMFPVLVWMYARLARGEEKDSRERFGAGWDRYASRVPAFIPNVNTLQNVER